MKWIVVRMENVLESIFKATVVERTYDVPGILWYDSLTALQSLVRCAN